MQYKTHDKSHRPWRSEWRPHPVKPSRYRDKVYRAILAYCGEHGGNTPTIRELMDIVGISSTSVVGYSINQLIDMGLLEVIDRKLVVVGAQWTPPVTQDI